MGLNGNVIFYRDKKHIQHLIIYFNCYASTICPLSYLIFHTLGFWRSTILCNLQLTTLMMFDHILLFPMLFASTFFAFSLLMSLLLFLYRFLVMPHVLVEFHFEFHPLFLVMPQVRTQFQPEFGIFKILLNAKK